VLCPVLLGVWGASAGTAFRLGLLFGYAYGWSLLWTLPETVATYLELPLAVAAGGVSLWFLFVVGVPAALFTVGAARLGTARLGLATPLALGALWVAVEFVRGRLLGQPWGLLGYSQHDAEGVVQLASVTGVYGLSFLLASVGAGVAQAVGALARGGTAREWMEVVALPASLAVLASLCGRLAVLDAADRVPAYQPVAVVQTNVVPPLRWTPAYSAAQVAAHLRATGRLRSSLDPELIVWPEYAVPRYLEADPGLQALLGGAARRHGADLLFGAPRADGEQRFNSAELLRRDGRTGAHYDKRRLVPFAEATPLRRGAAAETFSAGTTSGVLESFVPLGVSICHEILHPDLIAASVRDGARLLVNVANDSWLSRLSDAAGRQHLAMAQLRAVETRRYLVRAAVTGASAVFDPLGRVVGALPPGRPGVLAAWVAPEAVTTWYVRLGDAFAVACALAAVVALVAAGRPATAPALTSGGSGAD
jgi:apolipoprotein N-acyltransferase